jgi:hypothetical protein
MLILDPRDQLNSFKKASQEAEAPEPKPQVYQKTISSGFIHLEG